jgi:hypothetical protein
LSVRFVPLTIHVTVPLRPIVAPFGIGIVFDWRINVPIIVQKVTGKVTQTFLNEPDKIISGMINSDNGVRENWCAIL